jgi:hypothetical protein
VAEKALERLSSPAPLQGGMKNVSFPSSFGSCTVAVLGSKKEEVYEDCRKVLNNKWDCCYAKFGRFFSIAGVGIR